MLVCTCLCSCVYLCVPVCILFTYMYLYYSYLYVPVLTDAVAGHDTRDSTTVTDSMETFTLPDDICVKHLHIGIPKVYILSLSCHLVVSRHMIQNIYTGAIYSIMRFIIDSKGVENV